MKFAPLGLPDLFIYLTRLCFAPALAGSPASLAWILPTTSIVDILPPVLASPESISTSTEGMCLNCMYKCKPKMQTCNFSFKTPCFRIKYDFQNGIFEAFYDLALPTTVCLIPAVTIHILGLSHTQYSVTQPPSSRPRALALASPSS